MELPKKTACPPQGFTPKPTVDLPLFRSPANYRRFRQLLAALFRLQTQMASSRRKVAERFGLGLSHHQILTAIAEQQGTEGVSVRDLADYMRVSGSFIAAESKLLAQRAMVIKVDDPADRRRSLLRLSPEGERYVDEVADLIRPVNNRAFRSLDAQQLAQLEAMLPRLLEDAEAAERLLGAG
jgi:DNA-binding MarR family transcriptional regulator